MVIGDNRYRKIMASVPVAGTGLTEALALTSKSMT